MDEEGGRLLRPREEVTTPLSQPAAEQFRVKGTVNGGGWGRTSWTGRGWRSTPPSQSTAEQFRVKGTVNGGGGHRGQGEGGDQHHRHSQQLNSSGLMGQWMEMVWDDCSDRERLENGFFFWEKKD
jgi:hypothetical protein